MGNSIAERRSSMTASVTRFLSVGPIVCAAREWRWRGMPHITVVAKATLQFDEAGVLALVTQPDPIVVREHHRHLSPTNSLRDASDLVPTLPGAELLFEGSGYPPERGHGLARLSLLRDGAILIDKSLSIGSDGGGAQIASIPITYEQAFGGKDVADNPVGSLRPSILDPSDARRPIGLGPISSLWRARRDLLDADHKALLGRSPLDLSDGFPWPYFHAAPADQRINSYLRGDETIVLERLVANVERISLTLPRIAAQARVLHRNALTLPLPLVADLLRIDGERCRISLTWRGCVAVQSEQHTVIAVGVSLGGEPVAWPEVAPEVPPVSVAGTQLDQTALPGLAELQSATLPFARRAIAGSIEAGAAPATGQRVVAAWRERVTTPLIRPLPGQEVTLSPGDAPALRSNTPQTMVLPEYVPQSFPPELPPHAQPASAQPPFIHGPEPLAAQSQTSIAMSREGPRVGAVVLHPGLGSELLMALFEKET